VAASHGYAAHVMSRNASLAAFWTAGGSWGYVKFVALCFCYVECLVVIALTESLAEIGTRDKVRMSRKGELLSSELGRTCGGFANVRPFVRPEEVQAASWDEDGVSGCAGVGVMRNLKESLVHRWTTCAWASASLTQAHFGHCV